MSDRPNDVTRDDVPPDPVAAFQYGYRTAADNTMRVLYRLLGDPTFCRKGHEVWLHRFFDGTRHRTVGILRDGTIDECDSDYVDRAESGIMELDADDEDAKR